MLLPFWWTHGTELCSRGPHPVLLFWDTVHSSSPISLLREAARCWDAFSTAGECFWDTKNMTCGKDLNPVFSWPSAKLLQKQLPLTERVSWEQASKRPTGKADLHKSLQGRKIRQCKSRWLWSYFPKCWSRNWKTSKPLLMICNLGEGKQTHSV